MQRGSRVKRSRHSQQPSPATGRAQTAVPPPEIDPRNLRGHELRHESPDNCRRRCGLALARRRCYFQPADADEALSTIDTDFCSHRFIFVALTSDDGIVSGLASLRRRPKPWPSVPETESRPLRAPSNRCRIRAHVDVAGDLIFGQGASQIQVSSREKKNEASWKRPTPLAR